MSSSVKRVARILDLFTKDEPSLSNKEIAESLGIPQSTCHHFVKTLCQEGMLIQGSDRTYRLGWKLLEWSNRVMFQQEIYDEAGPIMAELVRQFTGHSHIGMFHEGEVRFVFKMISADADLVATNMGARRPAYLTSSGKILLAFNPSFLKVILERKQLMQSKNPISCTKKLKNELKVIKEQGYAISDDESNLGLYGVAAPIKSYDGQVVAAINFVGERNYMKGNQLIIRRVIQSARNISRQLGYLSLD